MLVLITICKETEEERVYSWENYRELPRGGYKLQRI
jgi:hypothetical protein